MLKEPSKSADKRLGRPSETESTDGASDDMLKVV
jgi:hypothetical protein